MQNAIPFKVVLYDAFFDEPTALSAESLYRNALNDALGGAEHVVPAHSRFAMIVKAYRTSALHETATVEELAAVNAWEKAHAAGWAAAETVWKDRADVWDAHFEIEYN